MTDRLRIVARLALALPRLRARVLAAKADLDRYYRRYGATMSAALTPTQEP